MANLVVHLKTGEGRVFEADVNSDDVVDDRVGLVRFERRWNGKSRLRIAIQNIHKLLLFHRTCQISVKFTQLCTYTLYTMIYAYQASLHVLWGRLQGIAQERCDDNRFYRTFLDEPVWRNENLYVHVSFMEFLVNKKVALFEKYSWRGYIRWWLFVQSRIRQRYSLKEKQNIKLCIIVILNVIVLPLLPPVSLKGMSERTTPKTSWVNKV